ncbi:MAG: helix-turn-helix transcriptional regulator [Caldilineaceae bacterium]
MEKFGQKLHYLRKQRGLTLRQLAELLGVHFTHLNNLEHGSKRPSTDLVLKVAQLFDVSTDQLMKDDVELM